MLKSWILPVCFFACAPLHAAEPRFTVTFDSGTGIINAQGELIARLPFQAILSFSNDRALVLQKRLVGRRKSEEDLDGFVDLAGHVVIPPQFIDAHPFADGLALVQRPNNPRFAFIDPQGHPAFPDEFEDADDFSEGLAPAAKDGKWGYIDHSGHWVIQPVYEKAGKFSEGLAAVQGEFELWGYSDKTGHAVIGPTYYDCGPFAEGMARVRSAGKDWGFINSHGDEVIPMQFFEASDFSEGLAVVSDKDQHNTFIDKKGKVAIPGVFSLALPFSEGLAVAAPPGRESQPQGYIDKTGHFVMAPRFYMADDFHGSLAAVETLISQDEKAGTQTRESAYIDHTGKVVWKTVIHSLIGDPSE